MLLVLLFVVTLVVAYANGANDNFKGVATLYGSDSASFRSALVWANLTTLGGALAAIVLGHGLARTFGGQGLVPDSVVTSTAFLASVGLAAGVTVLVATRVGLPISTTHALMGSLVGAGVLAAPGGFQFARLASAFLLALLLGPLVALSATMMAYFLFTQWRSRWSVARTDCACMGEESDPSVGVLAPVAAMSIITAPRISVKVGNRDACRRTFGDGLWGISAGTTLRVVHFLSAGAVGFARGLNDAPKIAALALAGATLPFRHVVLLVASAMLLGGMLGTRRVARTMSHRITEMNDAQGCTANLVTAGLVMAGSMASLPLSTTHVSCGALFGLGAVTGGARRRMIVGIVASWIGTLPMAALIAALAYNVFR